MNTVKLAHKSLNDELWQNYLKLALIEHKRTLGSSDLWPIIKQGDDYNFIITRGKILKRLTILKLFQGK